MTSLVPGAGLLTSVFVDTDLETIVTLGETIGE
jgi:hypothetical protein